MGDFFKNEELRTWLEERLRSALGQVDVADPAQVKFSPEAVAAEIAEGIAIERVYLDWDSMRASEPRVGKVQGREFGSTYETDAHEITVFVPLVGPSTVLRKRASTYSLGGYPDVSLVGRELAFIIKERALTGQMVEDRVALLRQSLDKTCEWVNADTEVWNRLVLSALVAKATARKQMLDASDQIAADLKIPIRKSPGAPEIVPVRPKQVIAPKPKTGTAHAADPQIEQTVYEQIVETIRGVGNAAERLPGTASKFLEEEWRDLLLFILNANYEGAMQGEAFNGAGKTDLLLRFNDKNAFIGECKFWSGTKAFGEAIDQLLGYTVWRDSKAALILFIRNKDATAVIEKADAAIRSHACFLVAKPAAAPESRRDYLVSAKDDPERKISLAFLPIVVRTPVEPDEHSTPTS